MNHQLSNPPHPFQFPFDSERVCKYTQQGMKASLMCLWFTVAASCRWSQNDTWDTSGMIVWAQNLNMSIKQTNWFYLYSALWPYSFDSLKQSDVQQCFFWNVSEYLFLTWQKESCKHAMLIKLNLGSILVGVGLLD